jgi:hypothetical protein
MTQDNSASKGNLTDTSDSPKNEETSPPGGADHQSALLSRLVRLFQAHSSTENRFSLLAKLLSTVLLLYVLIGIWYVDPEWWRTFVFEGGALDLSHWNTGLEYVNANLVGFFVVVLVLGFIGFMMLPTSLRTATRSFLRKLIDGTGGRIIRVLLVVMIIFSLFTVDSRIAEIERQKHLELEQLQRELARQGVGNPPLAGPTSFIFFSSQNIDSLYGQYEPELIPATIIDEMQKSNEVKAGVKLDEYLTTELGKSELKRRMTEYKRISKSSERKLKDLLQYLLTTNFIKRYQDLQTTSDDIKKLDDAVSLLGTQYGLVVDKSQLTKVRDQLLSQEILKLKTELKQLRGLVLIEGDWSVETQQDSYVFMRAFIENVTEPLNCELKLKKTDISPENREIIEDLKDKRIRASVFGNVIVGISDQTKTVTVNPMAVF